MQAHSLLDSRGVCVSFIDAECPVCVCVLDGCSVLWWSFPRHWPWHGSGQNQSLWHNCVCVCVCCFLTVGCVCVLHGCRVSCGDLFPRRWRWLGSGLNQSLPSNWRGFYLRARTDFILRTDPLTSPRRLCSSRTCPMPAARSASRS